MPDTVILLSVPGLRKQDLAAMPALASLANINSTAWIVDSAVHAAGEFQPNFFYIYLPHLDYAAQKFGPDSPAAAQALGELDGVLARLIAGMEGAYANRKPLWLVASE